MKNRTLSIVLITILSFLVVLLSCALVFALNRNSDFNFVFDFSKRNLKLIDKLEIDYNRVKRLSFNLNSTDIEIKESNDNNIIVEYYSNKDINPIMEFESDVITVDEEKNAKVCYGFCNLNKKIILYVPNAFTGEYDIKAKSGDIKSNVTLNNVFISTVSGDLSLDNISIGSISTVSGDVDIKNLNKNAIIKTVSGDVEIDNMIIDSNSSIFTVSGDVDVNNHKNNFYVETNTKSGDININKIDRKSDIILSIKTTSGDINVK